MNVLLYAQYDDPHAISVSKALQAKGVNPVLLERYSRHDSVRYDFNNHSSTLVINIDNKTYRIPDDFVGVFWRAKPAFNAEIPGEQASSVERFCINEWRDAANSIYAFASSLNWVNDLKSTSFINMKPIQLKLAQCCGLSIPETVISNDPDAIVAFLSKERSIYKSLSSFTSTTEVIYTTEIKSNEVLDNPNAVKIAPGIYQRLIEKEYELRVTVIGNELFSTKIDSQQGIYSQLDWRKGFTDEMLSAGALNQETCNKLLDFHHQAGLVYASYDFIVDKNGNEIFLECNPTGVWLWKNDDENMAIANAIADQLTDDNKSRKLKTVLKIA